MVNNYKEKIFYNYREIETIGKSHIFKIRDNKKFKGNISFQKNEMTFC